MAASGPPAGSGLPAGSGDILADRRYAYAEAAFGEDDFAAAADLARQALELAPDYAPASFLLGKACAALYAGSGHEPEDLRLFHEAVGAFEAALDADPDDRLGARLRLASLTIGDPLEAMSPGYVRALFDEYAIRFDRHLVEGLKYRGPALLHDAVRRACSLRLRQFRFGDALDLGCGTGLAGELFRPECDRLAGIDLSPEMVERGRRKKLYDELAVGDLVAWLAARPEASADLVLAADVLVYLGDLDDAFRETARVTTTGGLFAFTVQANGGAGIVLGEDLRFAHSERYLRDLAARKAFRVVIMEPVSTRQDRGEPVPGLLAVLER